MKKKRAGSLVDAVRERMLERPQELAFTFLKDGESELESWTRGELDARARAVAACLQAQGEMASERALLLYPPGLDFVAAFLGCLYAGVVAVPAYPPRRLSGRHHPIDDRLQVMARDTEPRIVLTDDATVAKREALGARIPELARSIWLGIRSTAGISADDWRPRRLSGDSLAFLQYTSGSTADPKGVMVTHANLLDNE